MTANPLMMADGQFHEMAELMRAADEDMSGPRQDWERSCYEWADRRDAEG